MNYADLWPLRPRCTVNPAPFHIFGDVAPYQCQLEQFANDVNNQIQAVINTNGAVISPIVNPPYDCNRP